MLTLESMGAALLRAPLLALRSCLPPLLYSLSLGMYDALPLVVVADKAVEFNTRVCACFPRLLFQLYLPYTVITQ